MKTAQRPQHVADYAPAMDGCGARVPSHKEYCHDRLGASFAHAQSSYDTQRRVQQLVDAFLTDDMLQGRTVLDVGCGLGHFSQRLAERGATVVACDLGPSLVQETRRRVGCHAVVADALRLTDYFAPGEFDGVVSSECIEHTPDPALAIHQMARVVKPGGFLSISTPNVLWYPVVRVATLARLRPFDGYENFSSWTSLRRQIRAAGCEIVREQGLHLFPFQIPLPRLSRWCDQHLQALRGAMINLCVLARIVAAPGPVA
jgi:2-polyprenyl-3-methyl-5-hydroxy-6-metoxy-1,4-benzoquinol methylase